MYTYTNLEQSKKLIELGFSSKTADMHYHHYQDKTGRIRKDGDIPSFMMHTIHDVPCWSLSALLKLMPILLEGYWRWILTRHSSGYSCTYLNGDKAFHSENGSTDIEAAYNMVVWLKKNNYV